MVKVAGVNISGANGSAHWAPGAARVPSTSEDRAKVHEPFLFISTVPIITDEV